MIASHKAHDKSRANQHQHQRSHDAGGKRWRLSLVLVLTALYMVAEAVGGWRTGSLALLADAGHMLTDVAAIALALLAVWFGARPPTPRKTYGYYRLEILAALTNGVTLVLISLFILREAYERISAPLAVESAPMILIATGGLAINLICAWLLHADHEHDLNLHGAWLHIIGDAIGSVGTIIAGALIYFYDWRIADPVISIFIAGLIVWSSWKLIREATNVLLEGTPAHINHEAVETTILKTEGVCEVHDLHIWTITRGREALSAHVVHDEKILPRALLKELRAKLHENFGLDHLTIQMETSDGEPVDFRCGETDCFRSPAIESGFGKARE